MSGRKKEGKGLVFIKFHKLLDISFLVCIIIIMVIFKRYFSGELIVLSYNNSGVN